MSNSINLAKSLQPTKVNTPLDARFVVETLDDTTSMQNPVLGGIFYCVATGKHYKVTSLQSATIGGITVENAKIGTYEEFGAGSGGGSGVPGQSATVTVGTVTTGQPGTQASVTNSGTSTDAVLNFTIPKGEAGQNGSPGTAATVTIGTVTTGAAGSSASVSNSGTSTNAVLDFVIPRGEQGIQGAAGSGGSSSGGGSSMSRSQVAVLSMIFA